MFFTPSDDVEAFRGTLRSSKNIVAVVGAGLSAASGIPTWRDADGVWTKYDPETLASPQAFEGNPGYVWQHYHTMRERVRHARPNAAHHALSILCVPQMRQALAPLAAFTLVTQNIDGLDKKVLNQTLAQLRDISSATEAAEQDVSPIFEMHGRVLDTLCMKCKNRKHDTSRLLDLPTTPTEDADTGAFHELPVTSLPHCELCGGLLRPGVVWFEESPLHSRDIWETVDRADLCVVIGTSLKVQPAAAYAYEVQDHGGKVVVFNLEKVDSESDYQPDFFFAGPCHETLPAVLGLV